jgi:hypothetical protein
MIIKIDIDMKAIKKKIMMGYIKRTLTIIIKRLF